MSRPIEKLRSLEAQFCTEDKTLSSEDFLVRELIATIYGSLEEVTNLDSFWNNNNNSSPFRTVNFIKSLSFLVNHLEKWLFWLLLTIFHTKTSLPELDQILKTFQKPNAQDKIAEIRSFIVGFQAKNRVSVCNCLLFSEFDRFGEKIPSDLEVSSLQAEFNGLIDRLNEKPSNNSSVIISSIPMVLNLSDNSNPGSEDNSPQNNSKDSLSMLTDGKKGLKMSKSRAIYRELYKKINESRHLIVEEQSFRMRDQDQKCWSCKNPISKGFLALGGNARFCYYYGRWFCRECMSHEKSVLPSKILKDFDFSLWDVSQKASKELKACWTLPVIKIPYEKDIVLANSELYETLILRRQLHLIFETICNTDFIKILLENNLNLVLQENLFSIKNLFEIHDGSLKSKISEVIELSKQHFRQCGGCVRKTNSCPLCKDKKPLYFFEIKKTKVCQTCKKVFHFKCFVDKGCQDCGLMNLLGQMKQKN